MSDETRFINPYTDQESLLVYRDMLNVMKTKFEEGLEEGIEQVLLVIKCLNEGKPIDEIIEITGLTKERIEEIQRMIKGS